MVSFPTMDATTKAEIDPHHVRTPHLGELVHYLAGRAAARAAFVMHVHEDGTTCDLVVLGDGDPALRETRNAWAMGHGVTRARLDVPHASAGNSPLRWRHRHDGA